MTRRSVEIVVPADPDLDDLAGAAEAFLTDHPELDGYDLAPRWADEDDRESVILTVPEWAAPDPDGDDPETIRGDYEHDRAIDRELEERSR